MQRTATARILHHRTVAFQIFQHAKNSNSSKPTPQNGGSPNLPTCQQQHKLETYIPERWLSKSSNVQKKQRLKTYIPKQWLSQFSNMPKTAKAPNQRPKTLAFQIFQHAKNSKSSKPTSQNVDFPNLPACQQKQKLKTYIPERWLSKSSNMPKTAKLKTYIPNGGFPNLPTCQRQQKLKTYIPKRWLSKSSNMQKTATAQNLHPKTLSLQIFQHAKSSRSSKPTSQNGGFPNLPTGENQQQLKTYIPERWLSKSSNMPNTATAQHLDSKLVAFQIFQHAKNSKSSKPTSQNGGFPNLPTCPKQQKLKTYIQKMVAFQILQHAKNSNSLKPTSQTVGFPNLATCPKQQQLKTYIPKRWLSKSSNRRKSAKAQNLHPRTVAFQIFQRANHSNSLKPTFQNGGFPNLPTCEQQQKLNTYIPKRWLSKSSNMRKAAKAQNLHAKTVAFQIFQHANNSKSSKSTSQNVGFSNFPTCEGQQKLKSTSQNGGFPNLPTCQQQQKLKTYIPERWLSKSSNMPNTATAQNLHSKLVAFQIFQHAKNTAKVQNLLPKTVAFQIFQHAQNSKSSKPTSQNVSSPNLPTFQKQEKLKTYIQKMVAFQILQHAKNSKSLKPTSQTVGFPNLATCPKQQQLKTYIPKRWLSKSSNMPNTATAQILHPKTVAFQIFQHAKNSKSSKPTSANGGFPNLPTCPKQQKLKTYIPKC